jgi:hypothetical protein
MMDFLGDIMSIESILNALNGLRTSRTLSIKERQEVLAAIQRLEAMQAAIDRIELELTEEEQTS